MTTYACDVVNGDVYDFYSQLLPLIFYINNFELEKKYMYYCNFSYFEAESSAQSINCHKKLMYLPMEKSQYSKWNKANKLCLWNKDTPA